MLGDILLEVLCKHPKLMLSMQETDLTYMLKELIIMEIVCLEGEETSSKDIQDIFTALLTSTEIPESLMKLSDSAKGKNRLKVLLNNILSSNLNHSNGLMNRKELDIYKDGTRYKYKASKDIINDIETLFATTSDTVNFFEMGVFLKKYDYIPLLIKFLHITTDYCQLNSNHINREALFPIFKNSKGKLRSGLINLIFICDKCVLDFVAEETFKYDERKY